MAKQGRGSDQAMIRLPEGMRDKIKEIAERNGRSMNSEIVDRLEGSFTKQIGLPDDLLGRIERKAEELRVPTRYLMLEALEKAFPYGYSVGEFVDKWAIPITKVASMKDRKKLIDEANLDPKAKAVGFSLDEYVYEKKHSFIEVFQQFEQGTELIASLFVAPSVKE